MDAGIYGLIISPSTALALLATKEIKIISANFDCDMRSGIKLPISTTAVHLEIIPSSKNTSKTTSWMMSDQN